jgi:hypothetical protein
MTKTYKLSNIAGIPTKDMAEKGVEILKQKNGGNYIILVDMKMQEDGTLEESFKIAEEFKWE